MLEKSDGRTELGQDVNAFAAPDLSPEDLTQHTANLIANALDATGLIEVREIQANLVNQVHILARVQARNAREAANKIVDTVIMRTDDDPSIEAFLGKQYLRKKKQGQPRKKLCFAWVFSFGSKDLHHMVTVVCNAIEESTPRKRLDVLESPLMGPGTPISTGPGSRGARPVKG